MQYNPEKDYYRVFGLSAHAPASEIKRRFLRLAKKYHPDLAPEEGKEEATEQFKEINEAYETLSDPYLRNLYDMVRLSGRAGASQEASASRGEGRSSRRRPSAPPRFYKDYSDETPLFRLFDMLAFAVLLVGSIAGMPLVFVALASPARLSGVLELLVVPGNLALWIFLVRSWLRRDFKFLAEHEFYHPFAAAALAGLAAAWAQHANLTPSMSAFSGGGGPEFRDFTYACRHILRAEALVFSLAWSAYAMGKYLLAYRPPRSLRWRAAVAGLAACFILSWGGAELKQRRFISMVSRAHTSVTLGALCERARLGDYRGYAALAEQAHTPGVCLDKIINACVPLCVPLSQSDTSYYCSRAILSAAGNPGTSAEQLEGLADEARWKPGQWGPGQAAMKLKLAANASLPPALLWKFASDPEPLVRRTVIENPAVPAELLRRLKSDQFNDNGLAAQKALDRLPG